MSIGNPTSQKLELKAVSQIQAPRQNTTISMSMGKSSKISVPKMSMSSNNYNVATSASTMGGSVDTSKWGQQSSMQKAVADDILGFQNTRDRFRVSNISMSASKSGMEGEIEGSFKINNSNPLSMKEGHFNMGTGAAPKKAVNKKFGRSKVVLAALEKEMEGSWGDVDRNYVIGGNWKSNGDLEFINSFPKDVLAKAKFDSKKVEVVVAPTDLHLLSVQKELEKTDVNVAAQDVSQYGRGAYTGNITADQLTDMKIGWTLTGHSERRSLFGESDQDVALKTKVACENGLNVMLCIGEQLEERESGKTGEVNARQL